MQLVARPRPRFAVIPTNSASLSRRGRGLRGTMVFLLFDQMHGEIVGFVQRKVGPSADVLPVSLSNGNGGTEGNAGSMTVASRLSSLLLKRNLRRLLWAAS
jgi:hypothetical protein